MLCPCGPQFDLVGPWRREKRSGGDLGIRRNLIQNKGGSHERIQTDLSEQGIQFLS